MNFLRIFAVPMLALSCHVCAVSAGSPPAIPADWIEVSADAKFSLRAPPGTEYRPAKGIDSLVGSFANPNFQLDFDYGLYSDSLPAAAELKDYRRQDVVIDGKAAKIVSYSKYDSSGHPDFFIGVHFPDLQKTPLGSLKLTVVCHLQRQEDYATLETLYGSIRFKPSNP